VNQRLVIQLEIISIPKSIEEETPGGIRGRASEEKNSTKEGYKMREMQVGGRTMGAAGEGVGGGRVAEIVMRKRVKSFYLRNR
jgi:hypothetical protein